MGRTACRHPTGGAPAAAITLQAGTASLAVGLDRPDEADSAGQSPLGRLGPRDDPQSVGQHCSRTVLTRARQSAAKILVAKHLLSADWSTIGTQISLMFLLGVGWNSKETDKRLVPTVQSSSTRQSL